MRKKTTMTHHHILPDKLWLKILVGMIIGIGVAMLFDIPAHWMPYIAFPGDLFMGLLKMIIVPLVLSSVILGVASAKSLDQLERMGARLIPYFIMTTAIAITIGIGITGIIQPGTGLDIDTTTLSIEQTTEDLSGLTVPDRILNMLPTNITAAQLDKNMLQLVILGIIVGIALLTIQTKPAKLVHDLCEFTQDTCMMVVGWAMWLAPLAVASLMIKAIALMGGSAIAGIGYYMACVLGGLTCMIVAYAMIIIIVTRQNPLSFFGKIRAAQIVAFSTSSSAATMPVSLSVAEERLQTNEDVRGFTIPLGATINMDGTALYQSVAAIFLCQIFGIELSLIETVLLIITTIGASIGTPAIPGVGLIVLMTILTSIGVPPEGVALILGVDRLLDMCRTTVNVTGDLTATAVMQHWMHGKT